jgi:hypothetical protein
MHGGESIIAQLQAYYLMQLSKSLDNTLAITESK